MRRTQLYLEDDVWRALQIRARQAGTTISDLVRQAVRERYLSASSKRKQHMADFAGIWKNRRDLADAEAYVRRLRRDRRLERVSGK